MIGETDTRLRNWVETVTGTPVSFDPPGRDQLPPEELVVRFHLLRINLKPAVQSRRGANPLAFELRYLVYVEGGQAEKTHHILSELLVAAAQEKTFELEPEPLTMTDWPALGLLARPSFIIRVQVTKDVAQPVAKPVRQITFSTVSVTNLFGTVVGPDNTPIAAARVEIPSLNRSTQTDHLGRFAFRTVPADPGQLTLRVKARGRELSVPAKALVEGQPPGIIYMNVLED